MREYSLTDLNSVVTIHNDIITANFRMGKTETKLFISGLRRIKKNDKDFQTVYIGKSEILPSSSGGKAYKLLKSASLNLFKQKISLEEKGKTHIIPLMSECKYEDREGCIKFKFHNSIRPYLLGLKSDFTNAEIKYLLHLERPSTNRIYWLLKSNFDNGIKEFRISIFGLKKMLEIKDKYLNYADFDKSVLNKAYIEILKTDICFNYIPIKIGKAFKAINFFQKEEFNIQPKSDSVKNNINNRFIEAISYLVKQKEFNSPRDYGLANNIKPSTMSDWKYGRSNVHIRHIRNLVLNYPFISLDYIILGKGNLIKNKM